MTPELLIVIIFLTILLFLAIMVGSFITTWRQMQKHRQTSRQQALDIRANLEKYASPLYRDHRQK